MWRALLQVGKAAASGSGSAGGVGECGGKDGIWAWCAIPFVGAAMFLVAAIRRLGHLLD